MAKSPTTQNRFKSLFRKIVYTSIGVGFAKERAAIAEMRPRMGVVPSFSWKPINLVANKSSSDLQAILSSSPMELSPGDAMARIAKVLSPFVQGEIATVNAANSVPRYRGLIKGRQSEAYRRQGEAYVTSLRKSYSEFAANIAICTNHPLLVDIERARCIHNFAQTAAKRGWPGADAVSALAHSIAQQLVDNMPASDATVPANFDGFGPHRKMEYVLSNPKEAASSVFRRVGSEMQKERGDRPSFGSMAIRCRDARSVGESVPFGDQLITLARREVLRVMSELPRDRHADLATYAELVHAKAREIDAEHRDDIVKVRALDISNEASISRAVNALQNISDRCGREFAKLAPEFLEKYIALRTTQDGHPADASPVQKITADQIEKLMPKIEDSNIEMPLGEFVGILQTELDDAAFPMSTPLAHGGGDSPYLKAIGKENSYTKLGADLLAKLKLQEREFDPDHFRRPLIGRTWRRLTTDVVASRLEEFEKLREMLFRDIAKMMKDPMFITDVKFGGTVALMEKVKSASPEMHLHFANAFLHAYEQIPAAVLEKVIGPEGLVLKASSKTAEREREGGMQRHRGMSM